MEKILIQSYLLPIFLLRIMLGGKDEGAFFEAEGAAAGDPDKLGAALDRVTMDVMVIEE